MIHSPIPNNLHLSGMSTKELNIWICIFEKRDDQAPCLGVLLDIKEFLLQAALVVR
jgi:hypothetical protein